MTVYRNSVPLGFLLTAALVPSNKAAAQQQAPQPSKPMPEVHHGSPNAADTDWGWALPGTSARIKIGGFARMDAVHDFNPIGNTKGFDISTIPVDGSTGSNTTFFVNFSRLNLDIRWPAYRADAQTFFEIDFYTDTGAPRIRHLYGRYGRFLFGQTWSAFTDISSLPPTIDFERPATFIIQRDPQIRYTQPLGEHTELHVAVEYRPPTLSESLNAIGGSTAYNWPGLVLQLRHARDWGALALSLLARDLEYLPPLATDSEHFFGWGINGNGHIAFSRMFTWYIQGVIGDGIGDYRGLYTFQQRTDGSAGLVMGGGFTTAFTVTWVPWLSSSVTGSHLYRIYREGEDRATNSGGQYFALNTIWKPDPHIDLGIEYLFGKHTVGYDASGVANRVQAMSRFNLP